MGMRLVLADRLREHVLERRHALAEMPHLGAGRRGERKDIAGATLARDEHAHDVFVGRMTFAARGRQPREERLEAVCRGLDAQLEHAVRAAA